MVATVLKPPAAEMQQLSPQEQQRFLNDLYDCFAEVVGSSRIKARADHFDELGAHSHVFWEPMTRDGRLCAKEVVSLPFFREINRTVPERMRERGWKIEDCESYDVEQREAQQLRHKSAGRSSAKFKADAEREKLNALMERDQVERQIADAREALAQMDARLKSSQLALSALDKLSRGMQQRLKGTSTVDYPKGVKTSITGRRVSMPADMYQDAYLASIRFPQDVKSAVSTVRRALSDYAGKVSGIELESLKQEVSELRRANETLMAQRTAETYRADRAEKKLEQLQKHHPEIFTQKSHQLHHPSR